MHSKHIFWGSLFAWAGSLGVLSSKAQNTTNPDTLVHHNHHLHEVVVTSHRIDAMRRNSPGLMGVTDSGDLSQSGATCLLQGLAFQPGLRTEFDCSNCGMTQVRINGLDGHYSQILIDGRPIFSALNGIYGLDQIPANMIERVEVVRGGGAALAGPSAIGGTINVVTREPRNNAAEVGHTLLSVGTKAHSYDNITHFNASLTTTDRRAGISIYAQNRHRDAYDHNHDGYTEMTQLKTQNAGFRAFYKPSPHSTVNLTYQGIHDFRRGGDALQLPPYEAHIAEQTEHNINGGEVEYTLSAPSSLWRLSTYTSVLATTRHSYYGGMGDGSDESRASALKAYGLTHGTVWVAGGDFVYRFKRLLFLPSTLTAGVQYSHDRLNDRATSYDYRLVQTATVSSMYVQNEWKCNHISLLVGGRLDNHNLVKKLMFSPRLNVRLTPLPNWDLRLSYARGFRAPQIYNEDLHTAVVGGERLKVRQADALHEERSNSFSLSSDWYHRFGNVQVNLMAEGFFTTLEGAFALRRLNGTDSYGFTTLERYNGSAAKVYGINAEAKMSLTHVQVQTGFTLQRSRWDSPQTWDEDAPAERQMLRTPNFYGYLSAAVEPLHALQLTMTANLTGPMTVGHAAGSGVSAPVVVRTQTFVDAGVKLSYDLHFARTTAQASLGVRNLFNAYQKNIDQGYNRDSNFIYGPELPRSYYVSLNFKI